jgi:hypothetical protein
MGTALSFHLTLVARPLNGYNTSFSKPRRRRLYLKQRLFEVVESPFSKAILLFFVSFAGSALTVQFP